MIFPEINVHLRMLRCTKSKICDDGILLVFVSCQAKVLTDGKVLI